MSPKLRYRLGNVIISNRLQRWRLMDARLEYNLRANPLDTFHFREPSFISGSILDRRKRRRDVTVISDVLEDALLASWSVPIARLDISRGGRQQITRLLIPGDYQDTSCL